MVTKLAAGRSSETGDSIILTVVHIFYFAPYQSYQYYNMMEATYTSTKKDGASLTDQGSGADLEAFNSSASHDLRAADSCNLVDTAENIHDNKMKLVPPKPTCRPTHKRTSSASHRRRHRHVHLMESISENAADDHLNLFVSSRQYGLHTAYTNDTVSNASTSSSSSVRRRRSIPVSSTASSSGTVSNSSLRRHQGQDLTNQTSEHVGNTIDAQGRSGLVASLDAGMKSLRKWIRSRKFASNSGSTERSSDHSATATTMRLGEEDISALSRAGDTVPIAATASSASDDSSSNLFERGGNSGFLYYRPNEVLVRHGVADSLELGSDTDESTDLLYPLVDLSQEGALRHRAYSEPDRTQVAGFFLNSVYGSRAIDTGGARDNVTDASVSVIEEGNTTELQEPEQIQTSPELQAPSNQTTSLSAATTISSVGSAADDNDVAELADNFESTGPPGLSGSADDGNINNTDIETIIDPIDPDRDARMRWLQINRQFRSIISCVALTFSFLLVLFLVSWVVMIATYILSLPKTCDVPLKEYFWLATFQLALDFFRAEIMKWMCRWSSNSRGGVPLRVLLYNIAYLIYAMLVLRLGITSVFVKESTCYDTAPELFLASAVFVSLTLLAWTLIIVGYIIPYATVAVLLTRNGYFPNVDELNEAENRRARLIGILPNNLANPAPPDCVEKLRVVMYDEFNDSFHKECCICLMEYEVGDGIVATPCNHVFHKTCCKEWLQLSRSCPICRRDIVDGLGEGSTLEEGSSSSTERRTSREWQRDASTLLQFLRRDQRSPRATPENTNEN